jgi:hypothetical protein
MEYNNVRCQIVHFMSQEMINPTLLPSNICVTCVGEGGDFFLFFLFVIPYNGLGL